MSVRTGFHIHNEINVAILFVLIVYLFLEDFGYIINILIFKSYCIYTTIAAVFRCGFIFTIEKYSSTVL